MRKIEPKPFGNALAPYAKKLSLRQTPICIRWRLYPPHYFKAFNPQALFVKWAAVAVTSLEHKLEAPLQSLKVASGLYAVFIHKGPASATPKTHEYIFSNWLPQSDYQLNNRPHLALMPSGYNPKAEDGKEEIWIPIEKKNALP
jgi:AraC family transcriptional regulator